MCFTLASSTVLLRNSSSTVEITLPLVLYLTMFLAAANPENSFALDVSAKELVILVLLLIPTYSSIRPF